MTRKIKNAKQLQRKSRSHQVRHIYGNCYEVTSGTSGNRYTVRVWPDGGAACTCRWGHYRPRHDQFRSGCSHVQATFDFIEEGRIVSAWTDEDQAKRQHRPMFDIGDNVILTTRKAGT